MNDEPVRRVARRRIDVPAVRRCADQHRARHCRGFAQWPLERAHRGRIRGDPGASLAFDPVRSQDSETVEPSLLGRQWIRVIAGERRRLDGYRLPRCPELVRDDLRQRGPVPLSRLDLRHCDCNAAVTRDLDIIAERLLALADSKVARKTFRPQRISDDQSDTGAAADQQCPSVDLQCAYWALSARRSILPVPSFGSGSGEMMIRCGILNLATLPSRKARKSSSPSHSPSFGWMTATGTSPSRSSAAPNTATSATDGQA